MKTIVVILDTKGGSTIQPSGFSDDSCLKETKSLEEALGKLSNRKLAPEAYRKEIADKTKVGA